MRFLHVMLRVQNLEPALAFWCGALGFVETRRTTNQSGRFSLIFLRAPADTGDGAEIELTYNWDQTEPYTEGRFFGHVAIGVPDVYAACARLQAAGYPVLRPPRDGRMAFVRSPDQQSVELLQLGPALVPAEPWLSMPNSGTW